MPLMYKRNPVILLADDDGTVIFAIIPRELSLTTGDLFDLRRQAEEFGLQLLVVESVAVDSMAWLEDEIVWAAHRRDAAATAPRTVLGLLAKGASYMDNLSVDLRIADGFDDGLNVGEPFGTLMPEAMAQRLLFRLADYDRQREVPTSRSGSRNGARAGAVIRLLRRSEARPPEDVQVQPGSWDRALTRAAELANKNPVSFSELVEKYCHSTALSDAVRLLEQRTVTAG